MLTIVGTVMGVLAPESAHAANGAVPIFANPTLDLQRTILTTPDPSRPTWTASSHPGDSEGLAYDPVRNTMWVSDDSKSRLQEIDIASGALLTTVTAAQLGLSVAAPAGNTLPPGTRATPDALHDTRPHDLEALAYDKVNDVLYSFAGPCCTSGPHRDPTAFRLVRKAPGGPFQPDTFQPLEGLSHFDLSGVGAIGGELWGGDLKNIVQYTYATNTIGVVRALPGISGHITGIGFSEAGANNSFVPGMADDMWITTSSNDILYRFAWHGANAVPTLVPNHVFQMKTLGLLDTRSVEIVDDTVWLADGYDYAPPNTPTEFSLHVYKMGQSTPTASFTTSPVALQPQNEVTGGLPFTVKFTDTSKGGGRPITWSWDFGDGTPLVTTQNPTHVYNSVGPFTVTLTTSNPNGPTAAPATAKVLVTDQPAASFTATPTTGPAPQLVTFTDTSTSSGGSVTAWSWNFGDGTPLDTTQSPTHTYLSPGTYSAALTVSNANGSSTTSQPITITGPPVPGFNLSASTGGAPLNVVFTDVSTGTPQPDYWSWNFGDGTAPVEFQDPAHDFAVPGVHTVTLTVDNSGQGMCMAGSCATVTHTVTVTGAAPTVSFTASVESGPAPLSVGFTDTSTAAPAITTRSWDFGDGSPASSGANPNHVFANRGTYTVTLTVTNSQGSGVTTRTITVGSVGSYVGLTPARLLDTRASATVDGRFSGIGRLGIGGVVKFPVLSRGGIPTSGVGAVVLNVTAIGPTAESYLTVWPTGATRPTASNLNYVAGQTFPNMVIVPLGTNGEISMFNAAGLVDLAVDVLGYFPSTSSFVGFSPQRLLDTRLGGSTVDRLFQTRAPIGPNTVASVTIAGRGGVPPGAGGSVALNVTAVGATATSYMTVWPTGQTMPTASNLNYRAGQIIPNMVIVPLGANGKVSLFNATGNVDVLVDVLGWFPADPGFTGLAPARLMDTRGAATIDGLFSGGGSIGAGRSANVTVLGRGGVPLTGVGSVALNVTAVGPTAESFMTVWPTGRLMPTASNLNYVAGDIFPNMVIVPVDANGKISLFNSAGSTDVLVDVLGWFPL